MQFFKRKYAWAVIYTVLLVSFTIYAVLDTFVITRVYSVVPPNEISNTADDSNGAEASIKTDSSGTGNSTQSDTSGGAGQSEEQTAAITENSYSDQNISITITKYREYDTDIYVADVSVSDIGYLKTAFAENSYGRNITEKTSSIASSNHAILAVNGDYYGAQTKGYVVRNGVLYRESASEDQEDLVIRADGSFEIITEGESSASQLLDDGALQVLSFGPGLITGGKISVSESDEVDKAQTSNPRTAIGIVDKLHYVFVVSDGRTSESKGLTLYELATFMSGLGVTTAYNLDGGGSSTMYFNGEVVNNPTTNGKFIEERSVSDIVYIGY